MFITFEGLDFCGKSTQVKLLEKYLIDSGKNAKVIREPGGTEISEKIRDILLDKKNSEMFNETELLLFSASRSQLVNEYILPLLDKGYYVISDRFHDSSVAYQGYGRGISLEFVSALQNFVIGKAVPDITFFIDLTVEQIAERRATIKHEALDRIESSKTKFYRKVREGYLQLAAQNKRFIVIDGMLSVGEIHSKILESINAFEKKG